MAKGAASFQSKLKAAQSTWGKARSRAESEKSFSEVEDGRYLVQITDAKLTESQASGRLQAAFSYVILQGENKGEILRSYDGLESEENQVWFGRKIARLGYDIPEDFDQIQEILAEITSGKPKVFIRVKTKGEFQNIYIDRMATAEDGGDDGDEATSDQAEAESSEEAAPPVAEDEDAEIEVGSMVEVQLSSGAVKGEVTKLLEDEGKVIVRVAGGKLYKVAAEKVSLVESVPEEPEVEPEEEEVVEEPKVTKKSPAAVKRKK